MKRSPLVVILLIAFVDLAAFGLIIPLQAAYAKRLDASALVFGCLVGVYSLMQFLFVPVLGRWSDRIGRRPVMLISVAGNAVSYVILGVADLALSLPLLFVARTMCGITGANIATAQSYIADVTSPAERSKGMGLFGAAFGLGFILGPVMAVLLNWIGTRVSGPEQGTAWPAFGAAAISAIAFVLALVMLPESRPPEKRGGGQRGLLDLKALADVARNPRVAEPVLLLVLTTFAFVLLEVTYVYLCSDKFGIGIGGVGLIFAYLGLIMVLVQGGSIGPLVRRFGEPVLIVVGPLLTAAGFVMTAAVLSVESYSLALVLLLVACLPFGLGSGVSKPALDGLISRHTPADSQGTTLGVANGLTAVVRAVAPPLGGLMYDVRGEMPYWVGAALLTVGAGLAWKVLPHQRRALHRDGGAGVGSSRLQREADGKEQEQDAAYHQ